MEGTRGTIGRMVRQRRIAQGLSLEALATRAGCAKSYLSEIENERRPSPPRTPVLRRLESALGLEAGSLVQMAAWAQTPGEVRRRFREMESRDRMTRRLVELMNRGLAPGTGTGEAAMLGRSLDAAYKSGELRALIDAVSPEEEEQKGERGIAGMSRAPVERALPLQVPLINAVAAGYPTEFTDLGYPARVADEYVRSPELADPDAFAARVVGESMLPDYRAGDIVIFSPARVVKSGMDCFVRLERDHESTFKRIFFQLARGMAVETCVTEQPDEGEWIRLQPLNPRYAVRVVHREEVAGMYAAVSVTRAVG
jgi:repressor LexA